MAAAEQEVRVYADTSFVVASRWRRDTFHREALDFYEGHETSAWLWTPWQRVETFNTLRQLTRDDGGRSPLAPGDARALIHRLETDVRLGYFEHAEPDWRDVMRTANELSIAHAGTLGFASVDLMHVAHAEPCAAELFVTFDADQAALAKAAGMAVAVPVTA